ncbi:hypothetical protein NDU88_002342 [Pleurodeles waltl]|uniref:Uncharacterized protein n=1 Tax=Pleurodeles waltl TaxID=8319 RepID=A0AAV7T232_PLEWA|nr:hypothetical protein NDU88_002342 [Pleurodeles waltl]
MLGGEEDDQEEVERERGKEEDDREDVESETGDCAADDCEDEENPLTRVRILSKRREPKATDGIPSTVGTRGNGALPPATLLEKRGSTSVFLRLDGGRLGWEEDLSQEEDRQEGM